MSLESPFVPKSGVKQEFTITTLTDSVLQVGDEKQHNTPWIITVNPYR